MSGILDGKSAIVTGGGGGLGGVMSTALADAGAGVLVADMNRETVEQAISGGGSRVTGIVADVTDEADRSRIVNACTDAFGGPDILINNAGFGLTAIARDHAEKPLNLWEVSADDLFRLLAVHAVAPVRLSALAIPAMRERGWGRIITVTTSLDTMIRGHFGPYGAAKAASEAYTSGLSEELAGTGVTVNVLVPGGAADTALVPDRPGLDRSKLIRPAVMGPPAVWLASAASDGVTGRRFIGTHWKDGLSTEETVARCSDPVAWTELAERIVRDTAQG